jgi:DNA modification methylase
VRIETIGDATLYLADASEVALPGVDALVTDPPYGIGEAAKKDTSRIRPNEKWKAPRTAAKYETSDWDSAPCPSALLDSLRALAKYQNIFGGNYFPLPPARCWLVWDKQTTGDFADCELAWTNLDKAVRKFEWLWSGFKQRKPEERYHPTQKPVAVMEWAISHLPDKTSMVLDPFMGSGTTGVACVNLGRKFIGIERDPKYFQTACERIAAAYAQGRLFA